jgi:hypothetical protein
LNSLVRVDHLSVLAVVQDLRFVVLLNGEVVVGKSALRARELREGAVFSLEVTTVSLLDDTPVRHDVDKVVVVNGREVVGDDDGRPVLPPTLDGLVDEKTRCGIESGGSFVCEGRKRSASTERGGAAEERKKPNLE